MVMYFYFLLSGGISFTTTSLGNTHFLCYSDYLEKDSYLRIANVLSNLYRKFVLKFAHGRHYQSILILFPVEPHARFRILSKTVLYIAATLPLVLGQEKRPVSCSDFRTLSPSLMSIH